MKNWRQWFTSRNMACALWVALCFALASAIYLSWLGRLVALIGVSAADWLSQVVGYLCQAAGLYVAARRLKQPRANPRREAALVTVLLAALAVPAILTDSPVALAGFGCLMNLSCGCLAGYYLFAVATSASAERRGLAFGGGYAGATVAVALLALIGGATMQSGSALLVYLPLAALTAWAACRLPLFEAPADESPPRQSRPREGMAVPEGRDILLAGAMLVLISAVKNLGFSFPSADIQAGLVPQLSRLPYAVGLIAAGIIIDRDRKNAMICTLAALALPFIMLGLINEPISSTVFWGLDYLFYGFFSVFRVVLFMDIAARTGRWSLAPLGLLLGRLGDVLGTAVSLLLKDSQIALIAVAGIAFVPSVFLLLRQFQRLYEPAAARQKSEQEVFESFCLRSDLSAREREVLRMILANHTNASIADALFITENTVKYHVRNVLQKTGCKNRTELQKQYKLALYPHLNGPVQMASESSGD